MKIIYLFLIILILYLIIKFIINKLYGFWAYQPVFHYYNLLYWIRPNFIINKNLPSINKFCNFLNIYTKEYNEYNKENLENIIDFLRTNYYNKNHSKYLPNLNSFKPYFKNNNLKSFITLYFKNNNIISVITSRPLNLNINKDKFKIYYVDNLCVEKNNRKSGIAPQIIQTHEYFQAHKNNSSQISLFKREGEITGIVPLSTYLTYQFEINTNIINLNNDIKLLEINKNNINLLINFLENSKNKFDCIIIPDISCLIGLIKKKIFIVYCFIIDNDIKCVYFFRDSNMFYYNNNTEKKALDLFCSINQMQSDDIFIKYFLLSYKLIVKDTKFDLITIENISDNDVIINYILKQNYKPLIINPTAYFLYNYASYPKLSKKCFILC